MLTFGAFGLFAAALVVVGRWVLRGRDAIGRPTRFPMVSVLVLVTLSGGLLVPVVRHHRLETRLSSVATTLVGSRAVVHCQTAGKELIDVGSELGYVRWGPGGVPEHQTLIKRGPCKHLAAYLGGHHADPSEDEVVAVHVLSHEARHMAGTLDEAAADCQAMQRDAWTAELLGATPDEARRLARYYWRVIYPRMPDEYRVGTCAPGMSLDEHRADPPWAAVEPAQPSAG